jgi:hypothetical protein
MRQRLRQLLYSWAVRGGELSAANRWGFIWRRYGIDDKEMSKADSDKKVV